jgi:hypothetical protein
MNVRRGARLLAAAALGSLAGLSGAQSLPTVTIKGPAAVVGMSSGGAMAVQLHVAHSADFAAGVGVVAGVPYDCAQGSVMRATTRCMKAIPAGPDVRASIRVTESRARSGEIDGIDALTRSRIYLASGTRDQVVRRPVMDALERYYLHFVDAGQLLYDREMPAGHAWISPLGPNACDASGRPWISDCGIDMPGRMMSWLLGANEPRQQGALAGELRTFDQRPFMDGLPSEHSLDDTGWVYLPRACTQGEACRLLVALHGCQQGRQGVGDAFVRRAGLNEWADTNAVVVLYPQVRPTRQANPRGCWDWWGYTGEGHATRDGVQVRAVMAMTRALKGVPR